MLRYEKSFRKLKPVREGKGRALKSALCSGRRHFIWVPLGPEHRALALELLLQNRSESDPLPALPPCQASGRASLEPARTTSVWTSEHVMKSEKYLKNSTSFSVPVKETVYST